MDILTALLIGAVGVVLGTWFARRQKGVFAGRAQSKEKENNKEKILAHLHKVGTMTNSDAQKLLGMSDATVVRYFDELEEESAVRQEGTTGRLVTYTLH